MLSQAQKEWILSQALVPEHLPDMMSFISGGEAALFEDDYLFLKSDNWAIFVGYPLSDRSEQDSLDKCIERFIRKYKPETLWLVSEGFTSTSLNTNFSKIQEDYYYRLNIPTLLNGSLKRAIRKASEVLQVEIDQSPTSQHKGLVADFIASKTLPNNIRKLYLRLPEYVSQTNDAFLLSAYTKKDKLLVAFFVVEMEAKRFSAYMIGCVSKTNYVRSASDLLMYELIKLSEKSGKEFINLGIGVNDGIRRFKEKWGGKPFLKYEVYEYKSDVKESKISRDSTPLMIFKRLWGLLRGHKEIKTMWQVSTGKSISYLIGSTHMFCYSFIPFLQEIIKRVDTVVVEGPLDKERMQDVINSGLRNTRVSLHDFIDNQTIELLAETYTNASFKNTASMDKESTYFFLKQCYISYIKDILKAHSHWMSFFSLWYMFLDQYKWQHSMDIDAMRLAQRHGKNARYLETIDEQINAMEGIPVERIVRFLKKADQWEGHIERFQRLYLKGSMDELLKQTSEFPSRCESIIDNRDPVMFERMMPYIEKGKTLILVGIGHIPGILDRLIKAGITIRNFYEIEKK
ncbi:MAG: TraB/GumN family protein [Thermodesulfovibrionales bacterium]|nr:TraB/GumN family protein [Thermodesulfovibrionales bacterium]